MAIWVWDDYWPRYWFLSWMGVLFFWFLFPLWSCGLRGLDFWPGRDFWQLAWPLMQQRVSPFDWRDLCLSRGEVGPEEATTTVLENWVQGVGQFSWQGLPHLSFWLHYLHRDAVPRQVVLRGSSHMLPHPLVRWFSASAPTSCPQSHGSQSRFSPLHTHDTYIFIAFPFLQMAVGEAPPTLPIRDELAEKIHRTRLTLC